MLHRLIVPPSYKQTASKYYSSKQPLKQSYDRDNYIIQISLPIKVLSNAVQSVNGLISGQPFWRITSPPVSIKRLERRKLIRRTSVSREQRAGKWISSYFILLLQIASDPNKPGVFLFWRDRNRLSNTEHTFSALFESRGVLTASTRVPRGRTGRGREWKLPVVSKHGCKQVLSKRGGLCIEHLATGQEGKMTRRRWRCERVWTYHYLNWRNCKTCCAHMTPCLSYDKIVLIFWLLMREEFFIKSHLEITGCTKLTYN